VVFGTLNFKGPAHKAPAFFAAAVQLIDTAIFREKSICVASDAPPAAIYESAMQ
jgi:hypothetical protein